MTPEEERTLITVFNNEVAAYIHDHFKPGTTGEHLALQHNANKHALACAIERERERIKTAFDELDPCGDSDWWWKERLAEIVGDESDLPECIMRGCQNRVASREPFERYCKDHKPKSGGE